MTLETESSTCEFRMAVAHSSSAPGDITGNVQHHVLFASQAANCGAQLIVFPESSLTGDEPTLAERLATDATDSRLKPLQDLADQHNLAIIAGCPIASPENKPIHPADMFQSGASI